MPQTLNLGLGSIGSRVEGLGSRVEGLGSRVEGLGFRVWGLGFSVLTLKPPLLRPAEKDLGPYTTKLKLLKGSL